MLSLNLKYLISAAVFGTLLCINAINLLLLLDSKSFLITANTDSCFTLNIVTFAVTILFWVVISSVKRICNGAVDNE